MKMDRGLLIVIGLCLLLTFEGSRQNVTAQEYRLRTNVLPEAYDIAFKPYLQSTDGIKQFTFDGEVNITLHAKVTSVENITLHKAQLEILECAIYNGNGDHLESINLDRLQFDAITEKLTIPLKTPLNSNVNYTLYFKYTGRIRDDLGGIYRATYDDGVNWYLLTQLHRTDARTAFPCFDEPQLKAKFRIRITRPKEFQSFFNTRLLSTSPESDGRYTDYYEQTPRMSSYGVAFTVGDFVVEGSNDMKYIMNSKFKGKTTFTQEVAVKALEAYDSYTQLPYKSMGNELMQMALMGRFPHSGMENWGLIMYKDILLAHEPQISDGWSNKERTVGLVTHEIGHMWFGNSLTHKWWSCFWLNEAFPTYYQHFLGHQIYPEYELEKQFVLNEMHTIFSLDATNSSQPLTSPEETIQTPTEVGSKFSNIAYNKGASVVRMIANAMGKENFDKAIREYIKKNHLKNPAPEDLFHQWKRFWPNEHQVDLDQLFKDWTEQPGFPMLRISATDSGHYLLKQERFLLDSYDGRDISLKYTIPITYTTNKEKNFDELTPRFYLNNTLEAYEFGNAEGDEWLILNLQQSNYHRVFYEAPLLEKLCKAFKANNHSDIHIINRAHLVDDLFTYGQMGLMGYDQIFDCMEYLATELEYVPWQPAFKAFETLGQRLTLNQHEKFGEFLFDILDSLYKKLGFDYNAKDSILDIYNRNKAISWLCRYHHSDCNAKAQYHFKSTESGNVPTDFQESLYCAAIREAQFDIYSALKDKYMHETNEIQKEKILRAMGCTQHYVEFHFAFILTSDVSEETKPSAIASLYSQTPENVDEVYQALTETFEIEILQNILGGWSVLASVISDLANYFTTQSQLDSLKDFIEMKGDLFGSSRYILENAVPKAEANLAWSAKHLASLFEYLDQRNGASAINSALSLLPLLVVAFVNYIL